MARFIDVDDFAPPPVKVQVDGTIYTLPGDVPVADFFALDQLTQRVVTGDEDAEGAIGELADRLLDLFQIHQPDLEALPLSLRQMIPLVMAYLSGGGEEVDEDQVPPPKRPAGTTKKPSTPRRKASTARKPTRARAGGSPK